VPASHPKIWKREKAKRGKVQASFGVGIGKRQKGRANELLPARKEKEGNSLSKSEGRKEAGSSERKTPKTSKGNMSLQKKILSEHGGGKRKKEGGGGDYQGKTTLWEATAIASRTTRQNCQ